MKKYLNKKRIILIILFVYIFFLGFKFLKGKSFFDTIVEYSNNIYSINADIKTANRDSYSLVTEKYIPTEYTDYRETSFGRYITRKEEDNNLYLYNPTNNDEILFATAEQGFELYELAVNDDYVIWLETSKKKDDSEGIYWRINAKMLNSDNKILIDEGNIDSKYKNIYMTLLPREFNIKDNTFIYTKYKENKINKNNIITKTMMTSIVKYDLNKKEIKVLNSTYDNNKEELSNIRIDKDNIVWQKKYKDNKKGEIVKAEVYKYSTINGLTEKIYESSDIHTVDIKGDNIAIVVKNPEDNIMIYNIKDKSFMNVFYKGSRIEKFIRDDSKEPVIIEVKFITPKKLFIGLSSKESDVSSIIYDLDEKEFLNFDKEVQKNKDVSVIQYRTHEDKLFAYVGISSKDEEEIKKIIYQNESEGLEEPSEEIKKEQELFKQNNLYYKHFEYLIR